MDDDAAAAGWTLWTSCLAWAEALTDWFDAGSSRAGSTADRAAVMAALAVAIQTEVVTAEPNKDSAELALPPDELGRLVTLPELYAIELETVHLHRCVRGEAGQCAPSEPGAQALARLAALDTDTAEWAAVLARVQAVVLAHLTAAAADEQVLRLTDRRAALARHAAGATHS